MFEHISENYRRLRSEIGDACTKAGRDPKEVRLMAVTKTVPAEAVNYAISLGIDLIGENYVQPLCEKHPHLNLKAAELHLIGHLQTNKVKAVLPLVTCIESVDSIRLARELDKAAGKLGRSISILAEFNVGQEESKFGFSLSGSKESLHEITQLPNLRLDGMMTVAPFTGSPEKNLSFFLSLRSLFDELNAELPEPQKMKILSMGMSDDFREAIAAGSTLIRVGTGLFGRRSI